MKMKLLPALVLAALTVSAAEPRVFTNAAGKQIKATLEGVSNGQATIVLEDGRKFTLGVTTFSPADQEYFKGQAAAPKLTGKNDKLAPGEVNSAVGAELFSDQPLWASTPESVAGRLQIRPESKTKEQASFRTYTRGDEKVFGAHPYSIALYGEKEQVTSLSLVFANKGDLFSSRGSSENHFDKDTPPAEAAKIVRTAMDKDLAAISTALTAKLGEPVKERFGERGAARMNMQRWDWRGHAILLADAEDDDKNGEYVGVQVVPTAVADAGGKTKPVPDAVVRARAKENIEKRPSGDVVITDIPMVDQGPKGYCVPATMERAMRFMSMPADMYVLANAGNSGYGGGTSVEVLLENTGRLIRSKGRSFDSWSGEMKLNNLSKHIDKGVPVIWALYSTKEFNDTANRRKDERASVADWAQWKTKVTTEAASNKMEKDKEKGHVVLIIGYNKETNEIAFSDSWGERFKERWITVPEADLISQGRFYVIGF